MLFLFPWSFRSLFTKLARSAVYLNTKFARFECLLQNGTAVEQRLRCFPRFCHIIITLSLPTVSCRSVGGVICHQSASERCRAADWVYCPLPAANR